MQANTATLRVRKGDWIQCFSGARFWPLDPDPAEIRIEDIAHALSLVCRFTGHVRFHYSVAQHSVLVAQACPRRHRLWGLLHDAAEAYIADVARPVKRFLPGYEAIEAGIMAAVCERFGLPPAMPAEVKFADEMLLRAEAEDLFPGPLDPEWREWLDGIPEYDGTIEKWSPVAAEAVFLHHFELYSRGLI